MLTDFLGTPIRANDWLAAGGARTRTEYGMVLHRVVAVDQDTGQVRVQRLRVRYIDGQAEARAVISVVKKLTRFVVVSPPAKVGDLFDRICGTGGLSPTAADHDLVGRWIHGQPVEFLA